MFRTFRPGPGFNENLENHEFPRFDCFVRRRNGPDSGAIMTENVFPVISVQSILCQLPFGTIIVLGPVFTIIIWSPKARGRGGSAPAPPFLSDFGPPQGCAS